jgi:large subunit ribosomal protein L7e
MSSTAGKPLDGQPASLPESHLRRRAIKVYDADKQRQESRKAKLKKKNDRRTAFRHAASFVREFKSHEKQEHRMDRATRDAEHLKLPPKENLLCVVRIKGINDMHPKSKKILQLLRLGTLNCMVFIKLSKPNMNMIKKIEPYVAYGFPTLKTVREVIYKRGHGRVGKERVPLTDNSIIEDALGKYDIICMEDLVHEIYTVGPHFKMASNFLWPVKLSNLTGGVDFKKGDHSMQDAGVGEQGKKINEIVAKMN